MRTSPIFFERSTSAINQQRSRNADRFPEAYAFELTEDEWKNLLSQFVISRSHGGRRKLPWAYTEHGFTMLEAEAAKLFAEARKTDAEGAHVWVEVYQKRLGMLGQLRTMAAQLDRDAVLETLDHAFGVAGGVAALAAPSALPRMAR
jgi:hypothetical protein